MYIRAKYKGKNLIWHHFGDYWYCNEVVGVEKDIDGNAGRGFTKDEAFLNLMSLKEKEIK